MKTNGEIRSEARAAVRGKWFWRIALTLVVLNGISNGAQRMVERFNASRGIHSGVEFLQKKLEALREGLDYTLPTQEAYRQMFVATGLEYFVALVLGSIALFGLTAVALRAMKNAEEDWFRSSVEGFRRPLDVTVLLLVQNLIVVFWALFLLVPGLVAAYRYRFAWYLKCENPDWGTVKCLGESARLIKGYKWRAFVFDCHYLARLFLVTLLAAVAFPFIRGESAFAGVLSLGLCGLVVVLLFRTLVLFVAGRAAFYREVRKSVGGEEAAGTQAPVTPPTLQKDDLPGND